MSADDKLAKLAASLATRKAAQDKARADLATHRAKAPTQSLPGLAARVAALEEILSRLI